MMIRVNKVKKRYGDLWALKDVDLEIEEGKFLGLVGPNGSGKSTLMKIIVGLIKPDEGETLFRDKNGIEKGSIGYMPETVLFYDNLTGEETLRFFARLQDVRDHNRIDSILKEVGLFDAKDRRVGGYSKGMKGRLNLAQALISNPDILILDEPTVGLDPLVVKEFYGILARLKREGKTIVLSTHVLAEIERKVDLVCILKNGEVKGMGSLEDLSMNMGLPVKLRFGLKKRDEELEKALKDIGGDHIQWEKGRMMMDIPMDKKIVVLSLLAERKAEIEDLTLKEPNLEEVFFGIEE
jgi:Cu-processing system ATP-binding protein